MGKEIRMPFEEYEQMICDAKHWEDKYNELHKLTKDNNEMFIVTENGRYECRNYRYHIGSDAILDEKGRIIKELCEEIDGLRGIVLKLERDYRKLEIEKDAIVKVNESLRSHWFVRLFLKPKNK